MRLAGHEWRTLISEVRLGRDRYRVARPARPFGHASLYDGYLGAQFSLDRVAAPDIAAAWWLAARSPRSLVYLPLRSNASRCGEEYMGRKLDLVMLHHSLGFPVSRWKQVRARLAQGKLHKVTMPDRPFPKFEPDDFDRMHRNDFRDRLRWSITADTLFLTGSRLAYELEADGIRELAEDCPSHLAENPDAHCCAEIDLGSRAHHVGNRRNPYAMLHIQCCNEHW